MSLPPSERRHQCCSAKREMMYFRPEWQCQKTRPAHFVSSATRGELPLVERRLAQRDGLSHADWPTVSPIKGRS